MTTHLDSRSSQLVLPLPGRATRTPPLAACIGAILALASQAALAAEQAGTGPALEEIVVTAQRRSENLQNVPLAITAFSGEALHAQGITNIKGLTERTPGLTMGQFNPGQPQIYVRGVGTNVRGAAEDPGVIVFVDEVYIGRAQGSDIDLFDLDRVEVLRGPQGTLFGRNVIGGAISMYTRQPGPDTDWGLQATYGDYNTLAGRGYVSGALADNLFGKVAFSSKSQDSYLKNHIGAFASEVNPLKGSFDTKRLQGTDSQSIRGQLRFQPSDRIDSNLTLYYSNQGADGAVRHFIPGVVSPTQSVLHTTDSALIPGYDRSYRNVLVDDAGHYDAEAYGANLRFDIGLTDWLTFTSLSAYRHAESTEIEPGIGTPALSALRLNATTPAQAAFVVDGNNDYFDRDKMFTQEFRLTSKGDSRLQWVAGLFYLNQDVYRDETATLAVKTRAAGGGIAGSNTFGNERQWSSNESYAVFGQATYAFTDQWSATLGGRYTHDSKDFHGIGDPGGLTINEAYDVRDSQSWSETTPKASIQFKPTSDLLFYASYAKGYKAGGYPNMAPNALVAGTAYNPEKADQFEIGAKTQWLDDRLRLNLAVFDIKYTDLQVLVQLIPDGAPPGTPGSLFTFNAADSKSKGAELEMSFAPTDRWLISGSLAYLDAKFTTFFIPPGFNTPSGLPSTANNGNYLRNAPEWSGNLLLRYTHPLSNGANLSAQADTRYKDKVYSDPANLEFAALPSYSLTDFRLAYVKDNVEIAAVLSNAFDENYLVHNYPSLGMGLSVAGAPRMAALTVTVRK